MPGWVSRPDGLAGIACGAAVPRQAPGLDRSDNEQAANRSKPTRFQIACMTLPYSRFSLDRALTGIKAAGYDYVAWGTTHKEGAAQVPVIAADAPPAQAKELGKKCRDLGLEPLMMFSGIYPEAPDALDVLKARIRQAAAAGMPHVLTFGHTQGGNRKLWVERFKQLGPMARDHGVTIVVKQHGGETGTGAACAAIIREVGDEGVKVNYDAGNVMDYLDVDPIPDIRACADGSARLLHQGPPQFPQGRGLRPRLRRDRPLPALAAGRLHRPGHAALLRKHLRPGYPGSDRSCGDRCTGPPGPRVLGGGDAGIAGITRGLLGGTIAGSLVESFAFRAWS